jgi:hypothetical protein
MIVSICNDVIGPVMRGPRGSALPWKERHGRQQRVVLCQYGVV